MHDGNAAACIISLCGILHAPNTTPRQRLLSSFIIHEAVITILFNFRH